MFDDSFKSRYTSIPYAFYVLERAEVEYNLVPHNHKEIEFIAMTEGSADFCVGASTYSLSEGDILVIPPYCVHHAKIFPHSSYDCICFDLSLIPDESLKNGLEGGELTVRGILSSSDCETRELHGHIRNTLLACKAQKQGWELEIRGRLSLVFSKLKQNEFFVRSHSSARDEKFCRNVIEYIAENYGESITSTSLSQIFYMNNSYFCRLFKKHFHCNFSDFINNYRIEKAKLFLEDRSLSISDIAIKCGFNSFSYFCKIFRFTVGCSPSVYRNRCTKKYNTMKHCGTQHIETPRLLLRPFDYEDCDDMLKNWISNPLVQSEYGEVVYTTAAEVKQLLNKWKKGYSDLGFYRWAIIEKKSLENIGQIAFCRVYSDCKTAEIEYCIGESFWGNGYANEALSAVIDYVFANTDFHRLEAYHRIENVKSARVLQKSAMQITETVQRFVRENTVPKDEICYCITNGSNNYSS